MSRIENLLKNYSRHIRLPLKSNAAAAQRVWFAVYPPDEERRLANRLGEFEIATRDAGYHWKLIDLRNTFAEWLDSVDSDERTD